MRKYGSDSIQATNHGFSSSDIKNKTLKNIFYIIIFGFIILLSCKKDAIEGKKTIDIKISSLPDYEPVDSVLCLIEKNLITAFSVITSDFTNKNGECRLEFDYEYKALSPLYLQLERFSSDGAHMGMTFSGLNKDLEYYKFDNDLPHLDFSSQNDFTVDITLVPLGKLHMLFNPGEIDYDRIIIESIIKGERKTVMNSGCNKTCCDSCYYDYYETCLDSINLEYSLTKNDNVVSNGMIDLKLEKFKTKNIQIDFE